MYRTAEEVAERIRPVLEKHGVAKGILFGSYALGTQTERSDVDLILVQRTSSDFWIATKGFSGTSTRFSGGRHRGPDLHSGGGGSDPPPEVHRAALREGKVIYEPR